MYFVCKSVNSKKKKEENSVRAECEEVNWEDEARNTNYLYCLCWTLGQTGCLCPQELHRLN